MRNRQKQKEESNSAKYQGDTMEQNYKGLQMLTVVFARLKVQRKVTRFLKKKADIWTQQPNKSKSISCSEAPPPPKIHAPIAKATTLTKAPPISRPPLLPSCDWFKYAPYCWLAGRVLCGLFTSKEIWQKAFLSYCTFKDFFPTFRIVFPSEGMACKLLPTWPL